MDGHGGTAAAGEVVNLAERRDRPGVYGSRAQLMERLAGDNVEEGHRRLDLYDEVVAREKLQLMRPCDVSYAMRRVFETVGASVTEALTFEEAEAAIVRESKGKLSFSEGHKAAVAAEVRRRNPSVCQQYGTPSTLLKPPVWNQPRKLWSTSCCR